MKNHYLRKFFTTLLNSAFLVLWIGNLNAQCVAPTPSTSNASITCGQTATLTATGGTNYTWYANAAGTQQVATGASFTTPQLGSNTTYYLQNSTGNNTNIFYITSLSTTNMSFFETNTWTGDDRGGMAVTQQYCYLTGDNNTARYDMPNLTNAVSYTRRDGIFSDMAGAGTLYTLWNSSTNSDPVGTCTSFTVNSVQTLNNDCSLGGTVIPTSQSFTMGSCNDAAVFNGVGFVVVYTGTGGAPANTYYKIDLPSGLVTLLGTYGLTATYTENWARWGVAEYNGNDYSVVYVTNSTTISRLNLTTGTVSTVQSFSSLSDMASIAYSPWDSRWYGHWEGGAQWGGSDESIGYYGGTHSSQNANACYSTLVPVTVTVNSNIPPPTATGTTINCGLTATLTATGGNGVGYTWYSNAAGTTIAGSGANFTTPSLGTTTTYYVASTGGLGAGSNFTFTNASATGPNGPTQGQINSAYSSTSLANNVTVNTQGIQEWVVPSSGNYQILVNGAQGGGNGGLGARMQGEFALTAGQKLFIVVGQQGNGPIDNNACGGGGGSFVTTGNATYTTSTPLIIAGGGGGQSPEVGYPGLITTNGGQGEGCQPGGTNGNGGADASACGSGAGGAGGFLTDGQSAGSWGYQRGFGFLSGAAVGGSSGSGSREGGFGGGAGTHLNNTGGGAGGGYSGGSASNHGANFEGGGGGSINNGINQVNTQGINVGNGSVVITSMTPLCASTLVPVTVTVNPATLPTASNVTTACGQPATINATGNGTIYWYSDQAGTMLLSTGNSYTTPPLGINTTYYVSTGTGVCGSQNVPVTVTVTTPANPTAAGVSISCGQTATITASGGGANNYIWYANAAGTQQIGTGATYTTPSLANTTTYYVAAGFVSNATPTTFTYTGNTQTYTVPVGVTSITVDAYGAGGGIYPGGVGTAGAGGRIQGTIPVTPGQVLTIVVGGAGGNSQYNRSGSGGGGFSGVLDATNNHLISAGGGGGAAGDESCPQVGGGGNGGSTSGSNGSCGLGGIGGTNGAGPAGGAGGSGTVVGAPGTATGGGLGGATLNDQGTGGGGGGYGTAGAASQYGSCGGNSGAGGFGGGGSGGTGGCGGTQERLSGGGGGGGGYTGGGGGTSTPGCAQCGGGGGGGGSNFAIPTATSITTTIGGGSAAQANGQLIITPMSASCQSGLTPVNVTVNSIGFPTTQNVSTPCGQTATLTASGNGTVYWYSDSLGTALVGTGNSFTTPVITSNTTYYASFGAGVCGGQNVPVNITITSPASPTASGVSISCGQTATLTATGGGANSYTWYTNAAGTTIAGSGANFTTPSLATTTTYYVASTAGLGAGSNYTFTNASATGPNGPTQGQINSAYSSTSLANNVTVNTQGIQEWVVPSSGNYQILVNGAQGGGNGGLGARMQGEFALTAGQKLFIVVGQQGNGPIDNNACGGGGGSFVTTGNATYTTSTPLIIAGGGGGQSPDVGYPGLITTNGGQGEGCQPGGTNGNGGADASACGSGAGGAGGFLTDGQSAGSWGYQRGFGFLSGAAVGGSSGSGSREGGFGGGAGTHLNNTGGGAGGGYSGGSASNHGANYEGGGGGSINNGINQVNTQGINVGNGSVVITSMTPLCASSLVPVTVTVNPIGLPTTQNVSTPCGQTATLNASGNGTVYWYSDSLGTALVGTGNSFTTPVLTSNTTYYASFGAGVCGGQNVPVLVTVTLPSAPTANNATITCGQTATLTASGGISTYTWFSDPAGQNQVGTGASFTTPSLSNTTIYYVGTASGPQGPVQSVGFDDCYVPANWNVVHLNGGNGSVNAAGAPANITLTGPNSTSANAYTMYETTIPFAGTLSWDWSVVHNDPTYDTYGYRLNGVDYPLTTVTATGSTSIAVTAGQVFSFYGRTHDGCCGTFTATITNFNKPCQGPPSCQSTLTAVQVTVTSNIAAPTAAAGPTVTCGQTATLTATGGGGNTMVWYSDSLGMNPLTTGTTFTTQALGVTTTFYVASGNGAGGGNPYSFTNAGATGETGPTQQQVTAAYANTNLANMVTVTTQGIQEWVVPTNGTYDITARGAQGGNANTSVGGSGAEITISATLNAGDVIKILCGQQGGTLAFSTGYAGGGGGGTYVYNQTTNQLILAAGGGGGAAEGDGVSYPYALNGVDASAYNVTSGANGLMSAGSWCSQGNGGSAGAGGAGGGGTGGAGWNSPGTAGQYGGTPGQPFSAGGLGGTHTMWSGASTVSVNGGFGGGAGAGGHTNYEANAGGGGGYSGGGGGGCRVGAGGGGGCFYTGTYVSSGLHTGQGSVDIVPQVPSCTSPLVPVTVTVAPITLPTASGVSISCGQTATLTATGNGALYWYSNSAGTAQVGTGNSYTTPVLTSTTTYYVSTATGICAAQNLPVVVTVNGLAAPVVSGNTNFCGNANAIATLTASGSPNGYSWWSNANGTGLLTNNPTFTTPPLNTTTTYYVQSSTPQGGNQTFNFTGAVQAFTAPVSGTYTLEAWGAQGGNDPMNPNTSLGGRGAYSKGDVVLAAGTTIYVYVGGQGTGCMNSTWKSTGGGGATDFRLVGGNWNDNGGLYSRILVAGGGGGRHGSNYENVMYVGNDGGGLTAPNFTTNGTTITGASQTAGGSSTYGTSVVPGSFGFATPNNESNTCSVGGYNGGARGSDNWANGGAGGGWYGGCTSWPTSSGGSGYVFTSTSFVPVGYTPTSAYHMTNEQLIAGNAAMPDTNGVNMTGNSGHGVAKITWTGTGCTSSIVAVTVNVGVSPTVSAGSNQDICEGNNVTLNGAGADTYQWDNNVQDGVPFTPATTQVYTVVGTTIDGCTDTAQVTVNVNPLPTVSLGPDTLVCAADIPYQLTATASANTIFSWSNGASGNPISISTAGTYTVTATNEFECSATDDIVIQISDCAGLNEEGLSLSLFPNPFNEEIQIISTESIDAQIEVYGSDGRLIRVQQIKGQHATLNLVNLARGNYMVKVLYNGKTHVTNLVKQ